MKGVQTLPKLLLPLLLAAVLSGCYTRPNLTFHKVRVEREHIGISAPSLASAAFVNYHFVGPAWSNSYWYASPFWDDEFFLLSNYYYQRYFGLWGSPYGYFAGSPFWGWPWNNWFYNPYLTNEENWQWVRWTPGPAPAHRNQEAGSRNARIRKSHTGALATAAAEIRPEVEWHAISVNKKDALPERRTFSTLRIREKPLLVPVESEVPLVRTPALVPRSPMLEGRSTSLFERTGYVTEDDEIYRAGVSTSELRRSGLTTGVRYRVIGNTTRSSAARVRKNNKK